jgi:hypothetical protein
VVTKDITGNSIKLEFGTSLDQDFDDEWFAVGALKVEVKKTASSPPPPPPSTPPRPTPPPPANSNTISAFSVPDRIPSRGGFVGRVSYTAMEPLHVTFCTFSFL